MRKLVLCLFVMGMFSSIGLAGKATSYDFLGNIHGNVAFNVPVEDGGVKVYMPMVVQVDGTAVTTDGGKKGVRVLKSIGTPSAVPLTGKALYNAVPVWVRPILKDLYLEALEEDVSQ